MQGFPSKVLFGLLAVFCVGTVLLLSFLGLNKGTKWTARLLLIEYLIFLVFLTVCIRSSGRIRLHHFQPFWSYGAIFLGSKSILQQSIMNVVAFIPMGLLLGWSFGRMKWWKVLLVSSAFSILIEALQFILKRGFAEFDDVFHNVLGCAIGFGVYVLGVWLLRHFCHSLPLRRIDKNAMLD